MARFLMRRLVLFLLALIGISLLIFLALRILPGDVAAVMAGLDAPPERVDRLRLQMGLDRSYPRQYLDWISELMKGDLGRSILTNRSIASQVGSRAQITFPLILLGLGVALLLGVPLGCAAALARSPRMQSFSHMVAIVGGSVPALWSGLLLIMLFAKGSGLVGLLPSQGFPALGWARPGQALASLILPALSTGIIVGAGIMRYTRSLLGDMLSSGYVDMGMACGMTRTQAALCIGLRLSSPQLVSVVGLTMAEMITGVMVSENLFALPGLGSMLITDVGNRDLPAVQSELLLLAAFFLFLGLLVDVIHRLIDPRFRGAVRQEVAD
ncbi:ABC transporter permease [Bifidobacterium sp. ESL0822]|uniref:ABC transporter permease n=1 Tax=Bifidobacterium sp. ESL0822 TaxID=3448585 RepID=UPI004043334F